MNKKERARLIRTLLQKYFPHPEIPLAHKDPYTLLIAVLLSAQSTDARVNQITPHLFAKASSPEKMIQLEIIFQAQSTKWLHSVRHLIPQVIGLAHCRFVILDRGRL